jgi:hypothetical protein
MNLAKKLNKRGIEQMKENYAEWNIPLQFLLFVIFGIPLLEPKSHKGKFTPVFFMNVFYSLF